MYRYLFILLLISCSASRTGVRTDESHLAAQLQRHVQYLSDDRLEGRRTGTEGERLAAEYISSQFQQAGLEPKGTSGFYQVFTVSETREPGAATSLTIEGRALELMSDYFPLSFSAAAKVQGMPSIALQETDMPWFIDLKDVLNDNRSNPHFDIRGYLMEKAQAAHKKGATALFVYNTSAVADGLQFDSRDRKTEVQIPVIYIKSAVAKQYFLDRAAMVEIHLVTEWKEKTRSGLNVIGFIDNHAPRTVVLGAHYDHLGFGEDKNSRHTGTDLQIHNGADDNASGTAALIELARLLKSSKAKNDNYLFIAFSGEELGLYGSKYFTQNPTVPLEQINYMINMDMIGRLNDSSSVLTVGGYGTSPQWGTIYNQSKTLYKSGLQFRIDSSGTGPSDHTSFYQKKIPVLFYFTGLHQDYHKPSDDFDKINYRGQASVVKHILSVIESAGTANAKLAFTPTREVQTTTTARFSVTLGIMPDYTYSGNGVRVDGVTANRPAEKAGIKAGDVITAIGDHKISSVEAYMQALSTFKKGDQTTVRYSRNNQLLSASIEF